MGLRTGLDGCGKYQISGLYLLITAMLKFAPPAVLLGRAVGQLVTASRCKQKGRGFYSLWGHWDFSFT